MIPAPFDYQRPTTVADAVRLLAENGEEAKVIAGGHSLLPMMKLRFAQPSVLVDIGNIDELRGIDTAGDRIVIGATSTHATVAGSALLADRAPLLAHAASLVGDPQVRHRGTIGGSLAHSDPAADLPVAVVAADATMVIVGPDGRREVGADEFFLGPFETAVGPDELLVAVSVPSATGIGWGYEKFTQRANDWGMVTVAVRGDRVVLGGVAGVPWRATVVEEALRAGASAAAAAATLAEALEPAGDIRADSRYRQHLAVVLTERALRTAGQR